MEYRAIEVGPFCGLFGLHFDEYSKWTQEEVVEKVDKAEKLLNLTPGKRCFVFCGLAPRNEETEIVDGKCIALCEILKARGYFILVESDGAYLPLHASKCDHLAALIRDREQWINYPCHSITFYPRGIEEPKFQPHTERIPKFLYAPVTEAASLFRFLYESQFTWTVLNRQPDRRIDLGAERKA